MELSERKLKEIEHSDRRRSIVRAYEYFTDASSDATKKEFVANGGEYGANFSNMKYYSVTASSFRYRDKLLVEKIPGAHALDFCCGNGEVSVEMALNGADKVWGIDLSPVAIDNAKILAEKMGVSSKCHFQVMDAEKMDFENESFDIIHEYGSLHHLELAAAYSELSRVLKTDGRLIATEALRHNPLIHHYRKRTPEIRTQWEVEHILGVPELKRGCNYFGNMDAKFYHLADLAAVPFRKTHLFKSLLSFTNLVDSVLLRMPFIRIMAWVAVVKYEKPKK